MELTQIRRDYAALKKGERIEYDEICRITRCTKDSPDFARKMLALKGRIENDLWMAQKKYTLRIHNGAICVLTDAEASAYNFQQAGLGAQKISRANKRMAGVLKSSLDNEQKRIHDHNRRIITASMEALEKIGILELEYNGEK